MSNENERLVSRSKHGVGIALLMLIPVLAIICGLIFLFWDLSGLIAVGRGILCAVLYFLAGVAILALSVTTIVFIALMGNYCTKSIFVNSIALARLRLTKRETIIGASTIIIETAVLAVVFCASLFYWLKNGLQSGLLSWAAAGVDGILIVWALVGLANVDKNFSDPFHVLSSKMPAAWSLLDLHLCESVPVNETNTVVSGYPPRLIAIIDARLNDEKLELLDGSIQRDDWPYALDRVFNISLDELEKTRPFGEFDVDIRREDSVLFEKWLAGFCDWAGLFCTITTAYDDFSSKKTLKRIAFEVPAIAESESSHDALVKLLEAYEKRVEKPEFSFELIA